MISSIGSSNGLYRTAMTQMREQMFNRIDTNGDGKHDKDELAEMVANRPAGVPRSRKSSISSIPTVMALLAKRSSMPDENTCRVQADRLHHRWGTCLPRTL